MVKNMQNANDFFFNAVAADADGAARDFLEAERRLHSSSAVFTRGALQMLCVPKILTPQAYRFIQGLSQTVIGILEKVITKYLEDEAYRALFGFSPQLERLTALPTGYKVNLPIARLDMFFNEEDRSFKFCEFNADGASAMNEDREIVNAWRGTKLWSQLQSRYKISSFELFDSWVSAFLEIYAGFDGCVAHPRVAIVDFLELGTKSEFVVFKEAFERRGVSAVIAEITDLKYRGGVLYDSSGNRIDAVYRRAVTTECIERLDKIGDLIEAAEARAVCLIGSFRTQVIHNKNIFRILRLPQTTAFLTFEEAAFIERHIPRTYKLEQGEFDIDDVLNNKDKWLIKPADRYASFGVATGGDYSGADWESKVRSAVGKDYILQEYCAPYKTMNCYFDSLGNIHSDMYNNLTGMFMYNGRLAGFYSRLMTGLVTTQQDEGRVTCTVIADGE